MNNNKKFHELWQFVTSEGRVCPQPAKWDALWKMLPNLGREGADWNPPLPLILGAWSETGDLFKALRLREHIEWARDHGALDRVDAFLRQLRPEDWHYGTLELKLELGHNLNDGE